MLKLNVLVVVALGCTLSSTCSGQETRPTSRDFSRSCDAIWSLAIASLSEADMTITSSDKTGGVAVFKGRTYNVTDRKQKLYGVGKSQTEDLFRSLTTNHPSGPRQSFAYRVNGGNLLAIPSGDGCKIKVSLTIDGFFDSKYGLAEIPLESNGGMETMILEGISKLLKQ